MWQMHLAVSTEVSTCWYVPCRGSAITSSEDGTVRVWDTEELAQAAVIKPTLSKPGRVGVTSCRYSPDGLSIAGGLADGSIHIWDVRGEDFGVVLLCLSDG